jgi:hypothetical protein
MRCALPSAILPLLGSRDRPSRRLNLTPAHFTRSHLPRPHLPPPPRRPVPPPRTTMTPLDQARALDGST